MSWTLRSSPAMAMTSACTSAMRCSSASLKRPLVSRSFTSCAQSRLDDFLTRRGERTRALGGARAGA